MVQKKEPQTNGGDPDLDQVVLSRLQLGSMLVPKRNQSGSVLSVEEPAKADGSALALTDLEEVSSLNEIGTLHPSKLLVALDNAKSRLYLMPVAKGDQYDEDTLDVAYAGSGFYINLYKIFGHLDRFVPAGIREIYQVTKTQAPVQIEEKQGFALVIDLKKKPKLEPIRELTEQEKAERKSRAAAKKSSGTK